jgi:hypothetical protein
MATAHRVTRLWPGETVVCLATGPSLTQADVDAVRGRARVIAINDAYRLAPWADVLYACDLKWWGWHWKQGAGAFAGLKYSVDRHVHLPGVTILQNTGNGGLGMEPIGLHGKNSGHQAINLAVHLGAARIVLLGYDMQNGPGRRDHFFGNHPHGAGRNGKYDRWIAYMRTMVAPLKAAHVEVINCTRATALDCFPHRPLEELFPCELARVS